MEKVSTTLSDNPLDLRTASSVTMWLTLTSVTGYVRQTPEISDHVWQKVSMRVQQLDRTAERTMLSWPEWGS